MLLCSHWMRASVLVLVCAPCCGEDSAQDPARPLPEMVTVMREVEAHQKASEALAKDYIYHSMATEQTFDGHGGLKKTETEDAEIFYVAGVRLRRITRRDGKELDAGEREKQNRKIDREIAQAKEKTPAEDNERDVVTVSRFLELGSFANPRRETLDGRETLVVDFSGDPKAKTRSRFEGAIREMEGTVWIDEQDRALRKIQGRFVRAFKMGAGLLADVKKDTTFEAEWRKVNEEVWLPSTAAGRGEMRVLLLVNVRGSLRVEDSEYRKFKVTATILPVAPSEQSP